MHGSGDGVRRVVGHGASPAVVFGILVALTPVARAQTVNIGPQGVTQSEGLGRAFETFSVFGGTPGIAAAYYYSDFYISSYQVPIAHSFQPIEHGWFAGMSPYAELTLGYLTADQTFALDSGPNTPHSAKLSFNTVSALAGAGLDIPVGGGVTLRPILLAGYARTGGDASFSGPNAAFVQASVNGILNKAAVSASLLGGAFEIVYEGRLAGDLTMTGHARYNELENIVTDATSPALKQNGSFGVANGGIQFSGPTSLHFFSDPVRWISYVNGTWLPGTDAGILGFNAFTEIGGGLQLHAPQIVQGVQGGTIRASAIVGPGVNGWLVSASLDF